MADAKIPGRAETDDEKTPGMCSPGGPVCNLRALGALAYEVAFGGCTHANLWRHQQRCVDMEVFCA